MIEVELRRCLIFGGDDYNGSVRGGFLDLLTMIEDETEALGFVRGFLHGEEDRRWAQIVNRTGKIIYDSRLEI